MDAAKLPREWVPELPATRVAWLWAWVLGCFIAVNLVLAPLLASRGYNRGYFVIEDKWRRLAKLNEPVDYLILGDSSCNQGIDPELLQQRWQRRALNLCTVGGMGLVGDAWMLEMYLRRFPPPKAVLLAHVYDIWDRDDSKLRNAIWNLDRLDIPWSSFTPHLVLSWRQDLNRRLGPWLPLYSQNQTLHRLLAEPERLSVPPPVITDLGFQVETEANPSRVAEDTQEHLALLSATQLRLSSADRAALDALASAVMPSNTPLVYVPAPVYTGLHQSPEYQVRSQAISALIDLLRSDYPTFRAIAEPPHFPPRQMQNADHVTLSGAHAYTEWLAEQLEALQLGAR